jgi:signal peptidase II
LKNKTVRLIVILVIILTILDQATKLVVSNLPVLPRINDSVGFEIATNTGLAFGFNDGSNVKNMFIMIFVIGIVIRFVITQIELIDTKTAVALSMVLSGGISNLLDRIFRGAVLDFIKIYKFPIFNIADVLVFIGAILLVIFLVIFTRKIEV